jgi:hypothetical protein
MPPYVPPDRDRVTNYFIPMAWNIRDVPRFMALMKEASSLVSHGFYFGDNLFTWSRNNSLFDDPSFVRAWNGNALNDADLAIAWRRYVLATLAFHAVQIEGDFVECGVYQGSGVKTVVDYLGGPGFTKTFWGFDTYDYNPVEGHAFEGQAPGFFEHVCRRFDGYPQVRLVKGLIPDVFGQHCPERIAFLHIDLNNAPAEIATLEHLFERIVPGGIVVLDDYEWSGVYRPQKLAEDPWFDARGYRPVPLPTGQALVIKR